MPSTTSPDGYVETRNGGRRILIRKDLSDALEGIEVTDLTALRRRAESDSHMTAHVGRGRHFSLALGRGIRAVVKVSRRGGVRRWVLPDLYFGDGRFLREIQVTSEAERRGISVAPIIASVTKSAALGFCRHHYLVRELEETVDLRQFLVDCPAGSSGGRDRKRDVVGAVATALRSLHDAGIFHADLNLGNIMIGKAEERPVQVVFIDLDTTRITSRTGPGKRARNVLRLYRSVLKAELPAGVLSLTDLARFTRAYHRGDRRISREAWRGYRRGRLLLLVHRLLWRIGL